MPANKNWQIIRKKYSDVAGGPVIGEEQKQRLYRNTEHGGPVDTAEELDQRNNLGPKDTPIETDAMRPAPAPSVKKKQDDEEEWPGVSKGP